MVTFETSEAEARTIITIAKRASKLATENKINYPLIDADMDVTACHMNGCPLDLVASKRSPLTKDIFGRQAGRNVSRTPQPVKIGSLKCARHELFKEWNAMTTTTYAITSQAQLRDVFWDTHREFKRRGNRSQNDPPAVRFAWVDFIDSMQRDGQISESLAFRATL